MPIDRTESDLPSADTSAEHEFQPKPRHGSIGIGEWLETMACIQCNAGLVCGLFAGLMLMIHRNESDARMSRIPSPATLHTLLVESGCDFAAGLLTLGSLGLFIRMLGDRGDAFRVPGLVAALLLTTAALVAHFVGVFVTNGSRVEDIQHPATLYPLLIVVTAFHVVLIGIFVVVMTKKHFARDHVAVILNSHLDDGPENEESVTST